MHKYLEKVIAKEPAAVYELMYGHEITVERFHEALAKIIEAAVDAHDEELNKIEWPPID